MKTIELSLTLRSQPYYNYFAAYLNDNGESIRVASDEFAKIFKKDRPLPASLRKDIGCDTCSNEVPILSRVDPYSSTRSPSRFSDNEIYVDCPKRAKLVEEYLREEKIKDGISDHSPLLQDQVKNTRKAYEAVQCLGCSGSYPVKVTHLESNTLDGVALKNDEENPYMVKRTILASDLLWGITNYIGRIEHKYDYADQLEVEDRESATSYLATKRLVNHILTGNNKYTTYRDLDTPVPVTLRNILSTIDGYDIINDRPNITYSTLFIAREAINIFIEGYEPKLNKNLKEDYQFALKVKAELEKLK